MGIFRALAALAYIALPALGLRYKQVDSYQGSDFLTGFAHQSIPDPTHGRVNYTDQLTALAQNLTFVSADTLIIRADSKTTLAPADPGRNSVRLMSNKQYTTHVSVWNLRHMPVGCATWPAVWEVGDDWPNQGEIDILEGVNDQSPNAASLHTSSDCTMPGTRAQSGSATGTNCDTFASNGAGCGVVAATPDSYGPAFNAAAGGFYAMERTPAYIKVWYWPRSAPSIPPDVLQGAAAVDTDTWGTPFAFFPNTSCDIAAHFGPHNIIINLTLCGDWAGAVYGIDGCPGDCVSFVNDNPEAFADAYFDVAWLKVYE